MKRTILTLTLLFFVVFSGLAATGAYIVYSEATYAQTKNSNGSLGNTGVKVKVERNSATFEITNALPGLIVLFLGVSGLILMLIKVPIREALISSIEKSKNMSSVEMEDIMINKNSKMSSTRKLRKTHTMDSGYHRGHWGRELEKIPLPVLWTLRLYRKLRK